MSRKWHVEHSDGSEWTSDDTDILYEDGWQEGDLSWPEHYTDRLFLMDGLGRLYFIDHTGDLLLVDTDVARAVWDG